MTTAALVLATRTAEGNTGFFRHSSPEPGIDARGCGQPAHVAAYIELLQSRRSAPWVKNSVKQHLACIRMLFDWLVIGQVMPLNPAHSVRGASFGDEGRYAGAVVRRSNRRCSPAWTFRASWACAIAPSLP
jgi:hypothetical protein